MFWAIVGALLFVAALPFILLGVVHLISYLLVNVNTTPKNRKTISETKAQDKS